MRSFTALALLALLAVASASSARVTPLSKVIEMLQGMLAQGKKEKHEEQVLYAAYKQFVDDTTAEKSKAIAEATALIEELEADIAQYEADIAELTKSIEGHDADIATWEGDSKALTQVREKERADYDLTHKDYSESVDALERAIFILKKAKGDLNKVSQAELLQVANMARVPAAVKNQIFAFLAQDPEILMQGDGDDGYLAYQAPEAAAYEFQSTSVIEMLEKLLAKFEDERTQLEKEETQARHAYEMLIQDLQNQIETATADRNREQELKANKQQAAADAKGELAETIASRDEDQKYLDDLIAAAKLKASEFEQRQQLRAEELEVLGQALEVLTTRIQELADKHIGHYVELQKSFVQLRGSPLQQHVASFLKAQGEKLNSRILSALAVKVESDPFKKVKQMIKDLIVRLLEEANEEAEHKGWCDTELSTNEQTRKEKTAEVDTLTAEIDELTASIAKLAQEITDLTNEVAELEAAMAEATKIRTAEKEKNLATIADAQEAQTALAQALTILREYYQKVGAPELLQQDPPPTWTGEFKGMSGQAGGVIAMLEVIQSDFARLETETKASEDESQRAYEKFMQDSEVSKVAKNKDIEFKTTRKEDQEAALQSKRTDLEDAQRALDAALAYYDKLKPSCVDAGVSYEDRVQRRKEEIESLQEALRILNGEDFSAGF